MKNLHSVAKRFLALAGMGGMLGCNAFAAEQTTVQHPEWSRNAVIYEVNTRQYTPEGTFNAFAEHLPRLKDLGVDILWFMPIHPISEKNRKGTLGSYYAVKDYTAVNPEFGTLDDFRNVVNRAHDLGMKVIIDWVPNHTGCDNAWVSEHPGRYKLNDKGQMYGPYDWTDVYQLDYGNPDTRRAMTDALLFWLNDVGIDGFRCDVAGMVPTDYWNDTRKELQQAQPQLFMLAEASQPNLEEHAFDMAYNWPMKDLLSRIASRAGQYSFKRPDADETKPPKQALPAEIFTLTEKIAADYPADSYMMNHITNHDLNSWEGTEFQRLGNLTNAMAALTYTLPGMPLIYTGQEIGMDHALQFFEKDPVKNFDANTYTSFYKTLNALKHSRPELAAGTAGGNLEPVGVQSDDIVVMKRTKDGSTTLYIANLGANDAPLTFADGQTPDLSNMVDAFSGSTRTLPASLAPGEYILYISK